MATPLRRELARSQFSVLILEEKRMIGRFKFIKHHHGVTAFAEIAIEANPSDGFAIAWPSELAQLESAYNGPVRAGIEKAFAWHRANDDRLFTFAVRDLVELIVDTKLDAVECAATMAAWQSFGPRRREFIVYLHRSLASLAQMIDDRRHSRSILRP
jgi:hypothetical protein